MIEVKTLEICNLMPVQTDNEFPFFTREVYKEINEDIFLKIQLVCCLKKNGKK